MTSFRKTSVFALAALLWLVGTPLPGQQPAGVAGDFPGYLPRQFSTWTGSEAKAANSSLPPALQQELGGATAGSVEYSSGSKRIHAQLERFRDPSSAYCAYTQQLQVGMEPTDVRPYSAVSGDRMILLVGNFLLHVDDVRNISATDLRTLALTLQGRADAGPLPPVRNYLPEEQLIQGTQRYALGPAGFTTALSAHAQDKFAALAPQIAFPQGAEAMMAAYLIAPNKRQSLLLIEYPTPQLAERQLRHIQSALAETPELANTTVERKASLLSLVLSPASEQIAADLRDQINYQTQVTWNEPTHTLTDPPWLLVVKNIFLGTLAFCGLALVLGLAFGGVRVITKRLLPGKVFDRPQDLEVLQLGLSGKRIDPSDFY